MNTLTLFMATCCVISIVLFVGTVLYDKLTAKKRKNKSIYDYL